LPVNPPSSPTNQSAGQGISIDFPNGSSLFTNNAAGALSVDFNGWTLSSSVDPAYKNATWFPILTNFPQPPPVNGSTPNPEYKKWNLTHQ